MYLLTIQGQYPVFIHPDSSSGYTEGEGWVVQLFIQEWQEHSLFTPWKESLLLGRKWQAAFFFFFFWSETRWWLKMQILKPDGLASDSISNPYWLC